MRIFSLIFILALQVFAAQKFLSLEPSTRMDWDNAVRFCFEMGGNLPTSDMIEISFLYKNKHKTAYKNKSYWTREDVDLNRAISYDFATGNAYIDLKLRRLNVVCIK